jgi:stearoyl-CoA 9-desaturase NADPH oxidoreductase
VPDWRRRTAYVCGPTGLVDLVLAHHEAAGLPVRHERFTPPVPVGAGTGGTVTFSGRGLPGPFRGAAGPTTPLLRAGEEAGALLPHGCRMGICRTCVGRLAAGTVHDLQTGEQHEAGPDQIVRTCVSAAAGDVHIEYP